MLFLNQQKTFKEARELKKQNKKNRPAEESPGEKQRRIAEEHLIEHKRKVKTREIFRNHTYRYVDQLES